jgi:hypothetical protein
MEKDQAKPLAMDPSSAHFPSNNGSFRLFRDSQNSDGGWGFIAGDESRVESTCWVVKALTAIAGAKRGDEDTVRRGLDFLTKAQLPDGSWPAVPETKTGCWVTSLACWVLAGLQDEKYAKAIDTGLRWVCDDWPQDSSWWRRTVRKLSSAGKAGKQNDAARGWGWTPATSSWVEPTAFALLALEWHPRASSVTAFQREAERRRKLGEALLYNRMCPGGGWNCGSPEDYGVPGEPMVIPTTWALLSLRHNPERRENKESLDWLENNFSKIQGAASYASARICLEVYGREREIQTAMAYDPEEPASNLLVAAWMSLAGSGPREWVTAGRKS